LAFAVQTLSLSKTYQRPRSLRDLLAGRAAPETRALTDASLVIEEGEVFGLLGPNGSGKTTLLKLLSTILSPSSGTARIFGADVIEEPRRVRALVSLVTGEERSLYWRLTARENLSFFASLHGLNGRPSRLKIDELLELFDLREAADIRVSGFSTGMRQRLAIARGLLSGPRLLFLDEPTRGLDPVAAHTLLKFVRERAVERYDNTVILTTHIAREVEQLCRRIAMLNRGAVVYQGTVDDLRTSLERGQTYRLQLDHLTPEAFEALGRRVGPDRCRMVDSDGPHTVVEVAFSNATAQLGDVLRQLLFSGVNIVECTKREQSFEEMFRAVFTQRAADRAAVGAGVATVGKV
jgi:ABC-2 type transport system ATP-binding protein